MSPSSSGDLVPSPRPVDVYFSADVECDGPVPGLYSMLSFGFVAAAEQSQDQWRRMPNGPTFYRELAPISEQWDNEALEVSGLDRTRLAIEGAPPSAAMRDAFDWIERVCDGGSPVLVCYPRSFDWLWLYWYFVAFCDRGSPFGFDGCIDVKTLICALTGQRFTRSDRGAVPAEILNQSSGSHNTLQDAHEQGALFCSLIEYLHKTGSGRES